MSEAHTVYPCFSRLGILHRTEWMWCIVLWFTGGCCGERGACSAARVLSGAQAEVGAGPGRLHGNRLFWQHSEEAWRFPEINLTCQTQKCERGFSYARLLTRHTLSSSFKHLMLTLPLNLVQNVNSGRAFSITCSKFPWNALSVIFLDLYWHLEVWIPERATQCTDAQFAVINIYNLLPVLGFLSNPATTVSIEETALMSLLVELEWVSSHMNMILKSLWFL